MRFTATLPGQGPVGLYYTRLHQSKEQGMLSIKKSIFKQRIFFYSNTYASRQYTAYRLQYTAYFRFAVGIPIAILAICLFTICLLGIAYLRKKIKNGIKKEDSDRLITGAESST